MSTSPLLLPFRPMPGNASLGTAFLPAIAKFRENVTLARHILPAGERSVRFDASDRWNLRFCTRKQAGSLMGPAMESCNGGLMPRCPWTVGSLSWGGAVVALASGAISGTIAPRPARSCPVRYGVAIASPRAKALSVRFRTIWGVGVPPLCFKPVNKSALRCAFDAFAVPFARLVRPCLGERSKIVHLTTRAGASEASATRPRCRGYCD